MLKTRIARLEDVAEPLRELYEAKDNGFVLKVEGDAGDVFPGLTTNYKSLEQEKKRLAEQLKTYDGLDPAKARQLIADAEKLEQEKLKAQGDWEAREKQLQEKFAAEKAALEQRIGTLTQGLHQSLIEAQATAAIAQHKGVPELLLPHVLRQMRVQEKDGKFFPEVIDQNGNPRVANSQGAPVTVADLVASMKADPIYGRAFEASQIGGSGAEQTNGGGGTANTKTRSEIDQMQPAERMQFFKGGGKSVDG
jgi:hypothetical protein